MSGAETVRAPGGATLYAPLLACCPVRVGDYPPDRRRLYEAALAESGVVPPVYPGSVFVACEDCGIQVVLGPRQQHAVEMAQELGLAAHVLCMLDASARTGAAAGRGEEPVAMHLGNPFKRAGDS